MHLVKSVRLLVITIATLMSFAVPRAAFSQVAIGVSVNFAPPELPVYEQPICPDEGYIWTPGYWAWDDEDGDYYWVPGTWVLAPEPGFLWTPGYWGWGGSAFIFHEGYWGPSVGFYGGINYGYGYFGHGYEGGRWDGGRFYYNRAVNNVNVTVIHNVYETRVTNVNVTRVSYNGPNGGINERPRPDEEAAARQRHLPPVPVQHQHIQAARSDRELRASENRGKPPIAATQRPGTFTGGAVVPAKEGGRYNPPPNRGGRNESGATNNSNRPENNANRAPNANRPPNTNRPESNANRPNYVHPNDLPKANHPDRPPSAGNSKSDQKYQQQQDKMYQKQDQERQRLQQKQDQEHQRMTQQKANPSRQPQVEQKQQQMEQRHQQQTQQMQQKHQQQQQKMEQRQQPRQQAPPHQNQQKPPNDKHP
jgi:hypothetical protein